MPVRDSNVFDRRRYDIGESYLAEREARILAMQAEVRKHELPAHGIEPRRGVNRPLVILTLLVHGDTPACLVEPSITQASAILGVETCSICEAIRERRPVRGHVIRYLDQIAECGELQDGLFRFNGRHEPDLSFREVLRLANADADAPAVVPSN